jgi:hypothetical protein
MELIDLTFFVDLGAALEEASTIDSKGGLFDAYFKLFGLSRHLEILSSGGKARLSATSHDLVKLQNAINNFERKHFRDQEGKWRSPDDSERSEYELTSLIGMIGRFRTVLIADLRIAAAFSVMRAGIFDVNLLVNNAHHALSEKSRLELCADTLQEIDDSGKCLAFNLPTASGFHAMRAVESVIKSYLAKFFLDTDIRKMNNWGHYLSALEKRLSGDDDPKPSQEAIALIRQIKDIYRNPVIHSERTLTSDEATTLFHSTLAALNRIAIELDGNQNILTGLLGGSRGRPRLPIASIATTSDA